MQFTSLDMDSKKVFDDFLTPYPFIASTYSFTNLYIWRNSQQIKYDYDENALYIQKGTPNPYLIPPVIKNGRDPKLAYEKVLSYLEENGMPKILKDATKEQVELIRSLGYDIEAESDRDNAEYIYSVEKMSSFSGKALHSKKNHFNNFIRYNEYNIKYIESSQDECIALAEKWYEESDKSPALTNELEGIKALIHNQKFFNIVGIAVFVDKVCQGFSLLEVLNENVILNHIEKADKSISGLYAFLAKTSMEYFGQGIRYTNREQDMGIPGLRKSKESYIPEFLEEKFMIRFI